MQLQAEMPTKAESSVALTVESNKQTAAQQHSRVLDDCLTSVTVMILQSLCGIAMHSSA
jgi:hypothetical protein